MEALVQVVLPVFLVIGAGYGAVRWGILAPGAIDGLMSYALNIAVPALLFRAISTLDIGATYEPRLLAAFYGAATASFLLGIAGARVVFGRPWPDAVAIGFCALFSNTLLLGLPVTEQAYGPGALDANYAIVSLHAPFCYALGLVTMEVARAQGNGPLAALLSTLRSMGRNAIVIGIAAGFVANAADIPVPGAARETVDLLARSALPAALFGLGGVLIRYRIEGSLPTVAMICGLSLLVHPALTLAGAHLGGMSVEATRSAVVSAAMAPGINAYVFAHMFGVGKRVAASAILIGTAISVVTVWGWLAILP